MIDLAILGLLHEQDLHGYELRKRITDLAGVRRAVSFGALYPALVRLEGVGAVRAVDAGGQPRAEIDDGPLPPTGSLAGEAAAFLARTRPDRAVRPRAGRARKAYGLTPTGEQLLIDLIEDPATDDRAFSLKVAFCRYLPPARRLELFERRRAILAGRLAGERSNRRSGRQAPPQQARVADRLDQYLRSLREHDTQTIQHDIAWLDELIASERAALTATTVGREEDSSS
ncbi:MAG TPA: helix-turn-helix transcriptional regulator [Acidimicrobiales bacterium]